MTKLRVLLKRVLIDGEYGRDRRCEWQTPLMSIRLAATIIGIFWLWGPRAMAADGLISVPSSYGPKDTMDRLETEITTSGMTVFARIDHAAGAAQVAFR
jgi:hypothetical protein